MKVEDFPFMCDVKKNNLGLSQRIYSALVVMNESKSFKSKDEIFRVLYGKTERDLLTRRNFGRKSLKELKQWMEKHLKDTKDEKI